MRNIAISLQGATRLVLHGFHYLRNVLTITVEAERTTIFVNSTNSEYPLILRRNATLSIEESLTQGLASHTSLWFFDASYCNNIIASIILEGDKI
jgi:hypothetical protein